MDSIYGLVSVWVEMNGCGNNYESHGFVRGLEKRLADVVFGSFGRGLKKRIDVRVGKILTCLGGD